jgi:O-antigen ligase
LAGSSFGTEGPAGFRRLLLALVVGCWALMDLEVGSPLDVDAFSIAGGANSYLTALTASISLVMLFCAMPKVSALRPFVISSVGVVVLLVEAVATSPWSMVPGRSMALALLWMLQVGAVWSSLYWLGPKRSLQSATWALTVVGVAGVLVEAASTFDPIRPRLDGIVLNANVAGQYAGLALLALLLVFNTERSRWALILAVPLNSAVLVLSQTRTVWLGLAACGVTVLAVSWRWVIPALAVLLVLAAAASVLLPVWDLVEKTPLARGQDVEHLATWNGRTDVWGESIELSVKRPLLGYGLGSGPATIGEVASAGDLPELLEPSSHSLPLDIWRELGLVGVLAAALQAAVSWRAPWCPARAGLCAYVAVTALFIPFTMIPGLLSFAALTLLVGTDPPRVTGDS